MRYLIVSVILLLGSIALFLADEFGIFLHDTRIAAIIGFIGVLIAGYYFYKHDE
jgi:hypothetical protein